MKDDDTDGESDVDEDDDTDEERDADEDSDGSQWLSLGPDLPHFDLTLTEDAGLD